MCYYYRSRASQFLHFHSAHWELMLILSMILSGASWWCSMMFFDVLRSFFSPKLWRRKNSWKFSFIGHMVIGRGYRNTNSNHTGIVQVPHNLNRRQRPFPFGLLTRKFDCVKSRLCLGGKYKWRCTVVTTIGVHETIARAAPSADNKPWLIT